MVKTCTGCGETKPLDGFSSHPNGRFGVTNRCRPCISAYNKARYAANREKIRKQQAEYRRANAEGIAAGKRRWKESWSEEYRTTVNAAHRERRNRPDAKEREREYRKTYYEANREARQAYRAKYYAENGDLVAARIARWKRVNRDKVRDYSLRRRARLAGAQGDHTHEDWLRMLRVWGFACAYCGNSNNITKEHVVPISRGGSNFIGNIIPACLSCNSSKCDKLLIEWLAARRGIH